MNYNRQRVRLTEAQLRRMIAECVNETVQEEGLLNQIGQGFKSFMGKGYGYDNPNNHRNRRSDFADEFHDGPNWLNRRTPIKLKDRFKAAKEGFKEQGKIDDNSNLINSINTITNTLSAYCKRKNLDVNNLTLKQARNILNGQNKASKSNISGWNNDIYRN